MGAIPITEVVPRIAQQLTLLGYELLDAPTTPRDWRPTWRPTCAVRCTWATCAISSVWDASCGARINWAQLMTSCAASQSTPALEPVRNHAFRYEASDIRPAITIDEFRSQRSGTAADLPSSLAPALHA